MTMQAFKVPVENLANVQAALAAINKRARRLKLPEVTIEVSETFPAPLLTVSSTTGVITKSERLFDHVTVTIQGEIPTLKGWRFVAAIESLDGETIIRGTRGVDLPEHYRTTGAICEHCNTTRRRNQSYVLQCQETGAFKAVGSTCLEDFTGAHDPFHAAAVAEMIYQVEEALGSGEFMPMEGGMGDRVLTDAFLAQVACLIRKIGFISAKKAEQTMTVTTGNTALMILTAEPGSTDEKNARDSGLIPEDQDRATAAAAIEWAMGLSNGRMSDFEHNLHAIAKTYMLPMRLRNIAACVVSSCLRAQQEEKERQLQSESSSYIGEVGKRMEFQAELVFRTALDSLYGTTYLHKFLTPEGAVCVWFASNMLEMDPGKVYALKGTVKKHEEREGVKQTIVNRVAFTK